MHSNRKLIGTLPVPPRGQPRPRCRCVQPRRGAVCPTCRKPSARPVPQMHPEARAGRDIEKWKADVVTLLRSAWRDEPLNGPVRLSVSFILPRPQTRPTVAATVTRKGRKEPNPRREGGHWIATPEAWKTGQRIPAPVKPDLDRLLNSLKDALTVAGVWWDDAQCASYGPTGKWYAAVGEEPRIELRVEEM